MLFFSLVSSVQWIILSTTYQVLCCCNMISTVCGWPCGLRLILTLLCQWVAHNHIQVMTQCAILPTYLFHWSPFQQYLRAIKAKKTYNFKPVKYSTLSYGHVFGVELQRFPLKFISYRWVMKESRNGLLIKYVICLLMTDTIFKVIL